MKRKKTAFSLAFLVAAYAHIKIREKRSVKSFVLEQIIRLAGMKKTFASQQKAQQALADMAPLTKGEYKGTDYHFTSPVTKEKMFGSTVYILNDQHHKQQQTVLYLHGGAWFQDPLVEHFEFVDEMAQILRAKVIMPIYPKIPHHDYKATNELITNLYQQALKEVDNPEQLIVMGDSAGGQIALSFAQLLKQQQLPQPGHIILISPVLDATMRHPEIPKYLKKDPMLGVEGTQYLVRQWAGDTALEDYRISPINGDVDGLGRITLTAGTKEILFPDAVNLSQLLSAKGIDHDFIPGHYQFHIYPVFNIPERQRFIYQLKTILNK
ncbi:alpha/beta hydrolase [Staphylococcus simiae]|uniref:alpha/beta hydrolase fold domain-containing protein n=1 Tax=Staphylococcus simiae TaxID=308354 RepID=UPI001A9731C4|nr:alpha/beta hydrolase [Staphylococcus simiae]MBO1198150.1 alpha/beta hydrolase [Staphylococcus simiae]MBO1200306.1 alpha/beta hydrolase [Staphylococcus simiae]MBO1202530.1 alpha/beta hydrolase [Staphylococcus simiae]MBO1210192.1 alpha/beta hydrolase [Staphylococcus simiae]MBO1228674.1 alpha/beta hydrolase [Staphylococcus simiae]